MLIPTHLSLLAVALFSTVVCGEPDSEDKRAFLQSLEAKFESYQQRNSFGNGSIQDPFRKQHLRRDVKGVNRNPDGSAFVWLPEDVYQGKNFFDAFDFFRWDDPTAGAVTYVNRTVAFEKKYAYVDDNGKVIMKPDITSHLPLGAHRESVRINTWKLYTGGLFILDLNRAPWGCAVWPAFWTVGMPKWPDFGEIDVLEGVHDNEHNQVAWHTNPGCWLDTTQQFTGNVTTGPDGHHHDNCDANINNNAGCAITEWSRASYGPYFEAQGGGVIAMKWDENDISVWSFFRAAIPDDILDGTPTPSSWGPPSAKLSSSKCDINKYYGNHTIVFNITFCGAWAGNSYIGTDCPGTCPERMMDPANFVVRGFFRY
ncbi:hypothetical protein CVT24_000072 [Panaeolus cyanescens]|uniref:GH16 domain-containing protein n=1 Tax=Panaeolus cyanescens TaxID=181874 RepID=A0A409VSU3_9AGAR|nr:hypothetical protein CVT24_000072 [Panaeolus cyanescens]